MTPLDTAWSLDSISGLSCEFWSILSSELAHCLASATSDKLLPLELKVPPIYIHN